MRRGVELSLNFIIIAVIVLVILLIAIVLVINGGTSFNRDTKTCTSRGGQCIPGGDSCPSGSIPVPGVEGCDGSCCLGA
ncbi:MAG: hypothetical protein V1725_06265 [archaeon]